MPRPGYVTYRCFNCNYKTVRSFRTDHICNKCGKLLSRRAIGDKRIELAKKELDAQPINYHG